MKRSHPQSAVKRFGKTRGWQRGMKSIETAFNSVLLKTKN